MTSQKRRLLQRAIDHYGPQTQQWKAIEELGELIQAAAKLCAGQDRLSGAAREQAVDHVAEEIADARIMLQQLCMILDVEERAVQWEYHKLARLRERIG